MHSTGTTQSEAEIHGGIAFSVVRAHTGALDREIGADRGRELADVGRFKMLFMEWVSVDLILFDFSIDKRNSRSFNLESKISFVHEVKSKSNVYSGPHWELLQ